MQRSFAALHEYCGRFELGGAGNDFHVSGVDQRLEVFFVDGNDRALFHVEHMLLQLCRQIRLHIQLCIGTS